MIQTSPMRTHASIVLSSLLSVGLAVSFKGLEPLWTELAQPTTCQEVLAQAQQSAQAKQENICPHRGSGRRDVAGFNRPLTGMLSSDTLGLRALNQWNS